MATFNDRNGREWKLAITVADLPRLRALCGVGPSEILNTELALTGMYASGPAELTEFAWSLCSAEAQAAGVAADTFIAGMDADALDRLFDAVQGEVVRFFNRSAAGQGIARSLPRIRETIARRTEESIQRRLSEDEASTSSGSAGNSPASSASTPGP